MEFPELVFGICGPIGVDMEAITDTLGSALREVRYKEHRIKLTNKMREFPININPQEHSDYYHDISFKIDYANGLRHKHVDAATLARIAIHAIRLERRSEITAEDTVPDMGVAYIVGQLKRPEEVELLRKVYGRQFVLVSAYGSKEQRKKLIESRLKRTISTRASDHEIFCLADKLIARDASEETEEYGQRLRETFHLADVFVDGIRRNEMEAKVNRFVQALFGRTDITPSKVEYGMYAAKSASLRSSDLSRQVGAAIFSPEGELITQGCNEVPKASGGTYWDLEEPDFRDVRLGYDPNEALKKEILRDLFERLQAEEWLSDKANRAGSPAQMVEEALRKPQSGGKNERGPLAEAAVMDLTEYGRVVHAEMCAICDAARLGRSLKGSTLFCTTFPCHNCTKHIIAAGIKRVFYMEPYPKSRAKDLHENEIEIEKEDASKVSFLPFLGISPFRYRDIFQKGKRKDERGIARRWYYGRERPLIEILAPFYLDLEDSEAAKLFGAETIPEITPESDSSSSSGD